MCLKVHCIHFPGKERYLFISQIFCNRTIKLKAWSHNRVYGVNAASNIWLQWSMIQLCSPDIDTERDWDIRKEKIIRKIIWRTHWEERVSKDSQSTRKTVKKSQRTWGRISERNLEWKENPSELHWRVMKCIKRMEVKTFRSMRCIWCEGLLMPEMQDVRYEKVVKGSVWAIGRLSWCRVPHPVPCFSQWQ